MKQICLFTFFFIWVVLCSGQVNHYLPQLADAELNPAAMNDQQEISVAGTTHFVQLNSNEYLHSCGLKGNFGFGDSELRTSAFRGTSTNMSYSGVQLTYAHWTYIDDDVRVSFGLKGHFLRYNLGLPLRMALAETGDIPVGSPTVLYSPDLDAGILLQYRTYSFGFVASGMTGSTRALSKVFYAGNPEQPGLFFHGSFSGHLTSEIQIRPSFQIKYSNMGRSRSMAGIQVLYRKMSGVGFTFDTNGNPGLNASVGLGKVVLHYSFEKIQYFDAENIRIHRLSVMVNLPG